MTKKTQAAEPGRRGRKPALSGEHIIVLRAITQEMARIVVSSSRGYCRCRWAWNNSSIQLAGMALSSARCLLFEPLNDFLPDLALPHLTQTACNS